MLRKNSLVVILIVLVVFILFVSIQYLFQPESAPKSIKIGYTRVLPTLSLFVAEENGYFIDEGIDVELYEFTSSNQAVEALVRGNVNFLWVVSAIPSLQVELQNPGTFQILSTSNTTNDIGFDAILVLNNSSIETIQDLEGKTIGVFPGSTATIFLKHYFEDNNVDLESIIFSPLAPPTQLPALYSGSIDALHAYEPALTIAIETGNARVVERSVYTKVISPIPQGFIVVKKSFSEQYPLSTRRVVNALRMALEYINSNGEDSREILTRRFNLDPSISGKVTIDTFFMPGNINITVLQDYADLLLELGELESRIDMSSLVFEVS